MNFPAEIKSKKCRVCKAEFKPYRTTQVVCGVKCAHKLAQGIIERKARKHTAERKKQLKTRSEWLKDTQKVVNEYVRVRDKGKLCISCDKPDNGNHQRHASHYRSTKACSALRFNTLNIWASCAQCNTMESGNLIEYRIRLQKKLPGLPEWLENQNQIVRFKIEYLERMIKVFRKKIRLYRKMRDD